MAKTKILVKISDYIVDRISSCHGVKDVFMIVGGGAMHLNDSVGRCRSLKYYCNHHEQASAIAAEGYSRTAEKLAVVFVTTGPGGTNAVTGLIGQWLDSVPVLYISGQVKQETCIASYPDINLRQIGDQEINIIDIVKPVTKYAHMITDPLETRKVLDKAVYIATHGRPGPVWIDVPMDIQGAVVDENLLYEYSPEEDTIAFNTDKIKEKVMLVIEHLEKAERPVFILGNGVRLSRAADKFFQIVEKIGVPVVSTFNGFDMIPTAHPQYIGRLGTVGDRAGNFALQNSDLVICVGSRNNIRQVGYYWESWAREAVKVIVDIDEAEFLKPTIKPDIAVHADAKDFLNSLWENMTEQSFPDYSNWLGWCIQRKQNYPVVLPEYENIRKKINPYYFVKTLTNQLDNNALVVAGNGTACVVLHQAGIVKKGQRIFWNSGAASMGYDLPAAIGACIASGKRNTICLAGDGSLQMNIQELQTVVNYNLPVKIFYLNNEGYFSIIQTQESFFKGRYVGSNRKSGVSFPDIGKIADAYGIPFIRIKNHFDMHDQLRKVLRDNRPYICEVILDTKQPFAPKASSQTLPDGRIISKPLEDLAPFLDREEFRQNMIIPPVDEDE